VTVVSAPPRAIHRLDPVWIPLKDGTRLAARVWLPVDADAHPVPAILEYLPYRRRDGTAERDALTHPYVAGHGYACVRVDMRGSGDSDGVLTDEYLPLEQVDALEIIAWLADQPWCTGAVGMMGHSWGGFNALQVAAHRPPALRAIITSCSTDDRYADDIHAMGGCLLLDNLRWASNMFAQNSRPPDPAVVGARWRDMWLARLRGSGLWIDTWLRHQRRDAFWQQGSVCEDYAAIQCAVYAVGGWLDAYTNAVPRLLRGLAVPRRALIGQWAHRYPHMALPGPAVGFLQLALDWWDTWLKGRAPGTDSEPLLRAWMQESVPPAAHYASLPGRWVAERAWPSPRITPQRYVLHRARLAPEAGPEAPLTLHSPETLGVYAGRWCPYQLTPDLPLDQRLEDGGALTFDTEPLPARLEILGAPVVELELAVDRPVALVAARLSDVAPDGAARRVSYGLLNLTHRESHEQPTALEPGRRYRVRLPLNDAGQAFPAGHRIRLALSTAYWPIAWPSPERVTLTVYAGLSTLTLPVRPPDPADALLPPVPPLETAPPLPVTAFEPPRAARVVHHDATTGEVTLDWTQDSGRHRYDDVDLTMHTIAADRFTIRPEDPLSARAEVTWTVRLARGEWRVETRTRTVLTATRTTFELEATLDAFEGDAPVHQQRWTRSIPRDLV
jgi:putative CocE/NonD family hydrolase